MHVSDTAIRAYILTSDFQAILFIGCIYIHEIFAENLGQSKLLCSASDKSLDILLLGLHIVVIMNFVSVCGHQNSTGVQCMRWTYEQAKTITTSLE